MFKIAICDDESKALDRTDRIVTSYMNRCGLCCEIARYSSGEELVSECSDMEQLNIIFFDVQMKQLDGLETARIVRTRNRAAHLVFVTSFISYALEGYKVNATRYILKDDPYFEEAITECMDAMTKKSIEPPVLTLDFSEGTRTVSKDSILYIEMQNRRLMFHVQEEERTPYTISGRLDEWEEKLCKNGFLRIHQSILVNLLYVKSIKNYEAVLGQDIKLPIPKQRFAQVKKDFIEYKGANA